MLLFVCRNVVLNRLQKPNFVPNVGRHQQKAAYMPKLLHYQRYPRLPRLGILSISCNLTGRSCQLRPPLLPSWTISNTISERPDASPIVASALGGHIPPLFFSSFSSQIWQPEIGADSFPLFLSLLSCFFVSWKPLLFFFAQTLFRLWSPTRAH